MPSYTLPNFTTNSTLLELVKYESEQVGFLVPGLLFFIYFTIVAAGYFSEQRRTGGGNFPMWLAIGGLITTVGSFFLLMAGIASLEVVTILIVITIASSLWFLLSKDE
jgi:drug/metabolite transporter (DMT)-like permease